MMSKSQHLRDELLPAMRVLKALGGTISFYDEDGEQFVITRSADIQQKSEELQLTLPTADVVSDAIRRNVEDIDEEVLERINRDIALSVSDDEDQQDFDRAVMPEGDDDAFDGPTPPPIRVKFEPLKGDLSPDLQD